MKTIITTEGCAPIVITSHTQENAHAIHRILRDLLIALRNDPQMPIPAHVDGLQGVASPPVEVSATEQPQGQEELCNICDSPYHETGRCPHVVFPEF